MITRRDLTVLVLALACGYVGGILSMRSHVVNAATPQTFRATRYELVDASGKTLAFWGTDSRYCTVLAFTGGARNELAKFGLSDQRGLLEINGTDGRRRVRLAVGLDQKPCLSLDDEKWSRLSLGYLSTDENDPGEDTWGLLFAAPPFGNRHAFPAAIGYKKDRSGPGYNGSITLEKSDGKTWKAP